MLTLDRNRTAAALQATREQCAGILWPKLKRLVNPNIVDAWIRVTVHVQDGVVNHIRGADSRPGYAHGLPEGGQADHLAARRALTDGLADLGARLETVIGEHWYGTVTLLITINGGAAAVSSEEDGIYRPLGK